jgi:hypothetical protein
MQIQRGSKDRGPRLREFETSTLARDIVLLACLVGARMRAVASWLKWDGHHTVAVSAS